MLGNGRASIEQDLGQDLQDKWVRKAPLRPLLCRALLAHVWLIGLAHVWEIATAPRKHSQAFLSGSSQATRSFCALPLVLGPSALCFASWASVFCLVALCLRFLALGQTCRGCTNLNSASAHYSGTSASLVMARSIEAWSRCSAEQPWDVCTGWLLARCTFRSSLSSRTAAAYSCHPAWDIGVIIRALVQA